MKALKRKCLLSLLAAIPLFLLTIAAAPAGKVELHLDGRLVYYSRDCKVEDGEVFLPLDEATLALGMDGRANFADETIIIRHKLTLIVIDAKKREIRVNRKNEPIKHAPLFLATGAYLPGEIFTGPLAGVLGKKIEVKWIDAAGKEAPIPPDPANETPAEAPAFDTAMRDRVNVIMIDPGHGGHEAGAKGPGGILEKDLTLAVGQKLRDRLAKEKDLTVLMTREDDRQIPLAARPRMAREKKADLFISIHANGYRSIAAQGFETFFASVTATDKDAEALAFLENQEGDTACETPPDVASDIDKILGDMAQSEWLSDSERLAMMIQAELARVLNSENRGVKQAPFRVLMDATMPAVLIEIGFITSPTEAKTITDPENQDRIVEAIAAAVLKFRDQTNARLGFNTH